MRNVRILASWMVIGCALIHAIGCTQSKSVADHVAEQNAIARNSARQNSCAELSLASSPSASSIVSSSAVAIRATCQARVDPPTNAACGQDCVTRGTFVWTIDNRSAEPTNLVAIIEITDDQGHAKKKEIPITVKARDKVNDTVWIPLITSYPQAGPVQLVSVVTIKQAEQTLATHSAQGTSTVTVQ